MPLILSGGLDAGNVAAAIALTHPYAVDSASGTESAPGHKDPDKLRAFIAAAHGAGGAPGAGREHETGGAKVGQPA